jgi:hypothetical protein
MWSCSSGSSPFWSCWGWWCGWCADVAETAPRLGCTSRVDLIERDARNEGLELKDVVNLALHEFFARREYLPEEV